MQIRIINDGNCYQTIVIDPFQLAHTVQCRPYVKHRVHPVASETIKKLNCASTEVQAREIIWSAFGDMFADSDLIANAAVALEHHRPCNACYLAGPKTCFEAEHDDNRVAQMMALTSRMRQ